MATYSYRESSRTEDSIVFAKDAIGENRKQRFFCPNPECNAQLFIKTIHGSNKCYFSASKLSGHIKGCEYSSSNGVRAEDFKEEGFSFDDAISKLLEKGPSQKRSKTPGEHPTGEPTQRTPQTLRQIYFLCKDLYYNESFNGIMIGTMLVDDRSECLYPKGVFGNRIIELQWTGGRLYDSDKKEIYLKLYKGKKGYSFALTFEDTIYYKEILREIYNNKGQIVVVAGNWEKGNGYNHFKVRITSKKQVYLKN